MRTSETSESISPFIRKKVGVVAAIQKKGMQRKQAIFDLVDKNNRKELLVGFRQVKTMTFDSRLCKKESPRDLFPYDFNKLHAKRCVEFDKHLGEATIHAPLDESRNPREEIESFLVTVEF